MIRPDSQKMNSNYSDLYDIVVPKNNKLRRVKDIIDFSFIYDEVIENYSITKGRSAVSPVRMFKYLFLKVIFDLSDVDVVERSRYDMSFKFFLDMAPEEEVIHPSSLTKFRKLRLKDMNLLDLLIKTSVETAQNQGVLNGSTLIVDATHSQSRYNAYLPKEILQKRSNQIVDAAGKIDDTKIKPLKLNDCSTKEALDLSKSFLDDLLKEEKYLSIPSVKEKINYFKETIEDCESTYTVSVDEDARVGHKSEDKSFFGYKNHLAMNTDRIITAAVVTTGEKSDGCYLSQLIEKSRENGVEVDTVIGDTAYSSRDNLDYCFNDNIELVSKLHPHIVHGVRKENQAFEYNKDAGMFVCPAGQLAVRKARQGKKQGQNQTDTYYFDIDKCQICPLKIGCYRDGAKSKTYSVTIKSETHKHQMKFMDSERFKLISRKRYMIEAKNSELKNRHGMKKSKYAGLLNMKMQTAATIFVANIKRIIKLTDEK
ncbi:IS1182 family transposase [Macrococcus brunensis]|uniref:IS1182 family transposase n=1 Tax=Macrococcus brunensis TaxID=198483 RepID=UPI001EF06CB7|nr:IS1182 family transposase [Macrococcus brunensis]ULG72688.1 IS1182 family transposase [Macrococcus brunensis]